MAIGVLFLSTEFFSLPPFAINYETEDSSILVYDATYIAKYFPIVQSNLKTEAASTTETLVGISKYT
jgi:hypothetical protein